MTNPSARLLQTDLTFYSVLLLAIARRQDHCSAGFRLLPIHPSPILAFYLLQTACGCLLEDGELRGKPSLRLL